MTSDRESAENPPVDLTLFSFVSATTPLMQRLRFPNDKAIVYYINLAADRGLVKVAYALLRAAERGWLGLHEVKPQV